MEEVFHDFCVLRNSGSLQEIQTFLSKFPLEKRKWLVNRKDAENRNALFYFCAENKLDIVNFILESCGGDIEMPCQEIVIKDSNSTHQAPPLWVAAIRGHIDIARTLLDHGADVNGRSDSQSTAVRTACYKNDIDMVKFLISRGADINIPNKYGSTCLMNSIEKVELLTLLIKEGANVNAVETGKFRLTALHYAIHNQSCDSLRVLLESGADVNIVDKNGDTPLISAASFCESEMADVLLKQPGVTTKEEIDCYDILGASAVDKENFTDSIKYWKKAMEIRRLNNIEKEVPVPISVLGNDKEHVTYDDIVFLSEDEDLQRREATLVKQRIFGVYHEEFLYSILQYAFSMRENLDSLMLFAYAHDQFQEKRKWLHDNNIYAIKMFMIVVRKILSRDDDTTKEVVVNVLLARFPIVVMQIQEAITKGKYLVHFEMAGLYNNLLIISLYMINILTLTDNQNKQFTSALRMLLRTNPKFKTKSEERFLHILVDKDVFEACDPLKSNSFSTSMYCPTSNQLYLIKTLIENGIHINARDEDGRTCLHRYLIYAQNENDIDEDEKEAMIHFLLARGAHIDTVDRKGENSVDLLRNTSVQVQEFNYRSLKCLAALVIGRYGIQYEEFIPITLKSFVALHTRT